MNQEKYIEQVLNSTNGITKVIPNEDLFSKIESRIKEQDFVSMKTIWIAAASIAVLICINITAISIKSKSKETKVAVLASELNKNNQLY